MTTEVSSMEKPFHPSSHEKKTERALRWGALPRTEPRKVPLMEGSLWDFFQKKKKSIEMRRSFCETSTRTASSNHGIVFYLLIVSQMQGSDKN